MTRLLVTCPDKLLHLVKVLPADNCLVVFHIPHIHPVFENGLYRLIEPLGFAALHIAGKAGVLLPVSVRSRRQDIFLCQRFSNLLGAVTGQRQVENALHHLRSRFIRHKLRIQLVAVRILPADEQAVQRPLAFGRLHLAGQVFGVHIVEDVAEQGDAVVLPDAVVAVVDGDVADALAGEVDFGVVSCLQSVHLWK